VTRRMFDDARNEWDVDAARAVLRSRLDEVRGTTGFPDGTDDAVVALSLPPHHTACANPDLRQWVVDARTDDADRADPGPFATDVTVGKGNAFYKAHSYPTKVPYPAIMRFLLHYTKPGDIVLDGFAGSGSTGVAAQACGMPDAKVKDQISAEMGQVQWGARKAVLSDLSPSASVIAAGLNLPIDAAAFDTASAEVLRRFDAALGWMYETTHTDGSTARIDYTVWSEIFTCPECASAVVFYDVAYDAATGRVVEQFGCPSCGVELDKKRLERRMTTARSPAGDTFERIDMRPVRVHYTARRERFDKAPDDADRALLARIGGMALSGPVPAHEIPFMHMTHERAPLRKKGFTHVHHLWGDRPLQALAWLWRACHEETDPLTRFALLFWVEQAFWGLSWQNRYKATDHSQVNRQQTGVYYVGSLVSECSPAYNLAGTQPSKGKRQNLVKLWASSPAKLGNVAISTGSSTALDLPDDSIDYVFVDPPFGANIYYADLAYLIEAWHGVYTRSADEAIENQSKRRPRTLGEYGVLMAACFDEFYRVLKPGRWLTVEFSNHSNEVWLAVQRALEQAGFMVADTRILDKEQLSYRQVTAASSAKKDLVISCYKPKLAMTQPTVGNSGNPDTAWAFIREHLSHLPTATGQRGESQAIRERMADRLYDRMISFHVSRKLAVPVTTGEFNAGLDQRFPMRDAMYFLDSQLESYEQHRMTFVALLEQSLFITDESSAVQWLRQLLKSRSRAQAYSEVVPAFLTEMGNGIAEWEELPELLVMLEENFLQDGEGRWYVPDPKKATDLEKLRRRSLLKEFETYRSSNGALTRFRSEAVRAGFDEAWDRQEFDVIVEVGGRLPAEALVDDPALRYFLDNAEMLST
jgi:16S rRNA G966 N2-methylase RsmD/Zn-finger nucleic acid-binding protein